MKFLVEQYFGFVSVNGRYDSFLWKELFLYGSPLFSFLCRVSIVDFVCMFSILVRIFSSNITPFWSFRKNRSEPSGMGIWGCWSLLPRLASSSAIWFPLVIICHSAP